MPVNYANAYPSFADLEAVARRRLPRASWDYLSGAAGDESGLAHNRAAYNAVRFVPDYLIERAAPDTSQTLFGRKYAFPFGVAPIGQAGFIWPRAAEYLAAAAKEANIPFCLSLLGTTSIERIGELAGANAWYQHYPLRDIGVTRDVCDRARAAGFSAMLVTVDTPAGRRTLRDLRNGLTLRPRLSAANIARMLAHPAWLAATAAAGLPKFETLLRYFPPDADFTGVEVLHQHLLRRGGLDIKGLEAVRKCWDGPMLVKGILGVADAKACRALGAQGLVLSNHGARQSESLVSPLEALPHIRDALGDDLVLAVDSGARSGLDVARAIALGAQLVLLGRAFMFSVAALGEPGARHACELLATEFTQIMGHLGCFTLADLPRRLARDGGIEPTIERKPLLKAAT